MIRLVRLRLGYRHKYIPISLPSSNCSNDKLKPISNVSFSSRKIIPEADMDDLDLRRAGTNHMRFCFEPHNMGGPKFVCCFCGAYICRIDTSINSRARPYTFRVNGQNYHMIRSLLPISGNKPRFAQLYTYGIENEINNRLSALNHDHDKSNIDRTIVEGLMNMLDVNNEIVKAF
ncbi:hypothetical protein CRYUN_Cryun26dG0080700 [Craigia yunnanensis]